VPSEADLARLTPTANPAGIQKVLFQGIWNSANQAYLKKLDRQEQGKVMVYTLLRSKSLLNHIHLCLQYHQVLPSVDTEFLECSEENPLALLIIIKLLITARPDSNEELDPQKAFGEWLTLTMKHAEKIIDYGRRAVKAIDNWDPGEGSTASKATIDVLHRWTR
jgi:hypothetical protein